jgi:hypothetical protein
MTDIVSNILSPNKEEALPTVAKLLRYTAISR